LLQNSHGKELESTARHKVCSPLPCGPPIDVPRPLGLDHVHRTKETVGKGFWEPPAPTPLLAGSWNIGSDAGLLLGNKHFQCSVGRRLAEDDGPGGTGEPPLSVATTFTAPVVPPSQLPA
jgi:hypothetical protein